MSSWVIVALVLNATLVVVAIVLAVRLAGRSVVVAVELELELHPSPVAAVEIDDRPRLPLFSHAQMSRTEWRALLEAFDAARAVYLKELTAWRNEHTRTPGALSRARHELDVAKSRLTRFEREISLGAGRGKLSAPRMRATSVG